MGKERITVTIREGLLKQIDHFIDEKDVRNRSHAIEKVLLEKFGDMTVEQAIILGGGKGVSMDGGKTTISPLLFPIDGKLVIERHIEQLKNAGVEELFLSVGTFGDEVRKVVGDGSKYDMKVLYFERDHGTASILRQAKDLLKETFLMLNGHILFESVDIEDMLVFHKNSKSPCTMSLTTVGEPAGYGQIRMRGNRIVEFVEKPEQTLSHIVNAGIYVIDPSVCDMVTPETVSFEKEVLSVLAKENHLSGYMLDQPWQRITDYLKK